MFAIINEDLESEETLRTDGEFSDQSIKVYCCTHFLYFFYKFSYNFLNLLIFESKFSGTSKIHFEISVCLAELRVRGMNS